MSEKIIYDIVYGIVRRAIEDCDSCESVGKTAESQVADIVHSVNVAADDALYVASATMGGMNPWPSLQGSDKTPEDQATDRFQHLVNQHGRAVKKAIGEAAARGRRARSPRED